MASYFVQKALKQFSPMAQRSGCGKAGFFGRREGFVTVAFKGGEDGPITKKDLLFAVGGIITVFSAGLTCAGYVIIVLSAEIKNGVKDFEAKFGEQKGKIDGMNDRFKGQDDRFKGQEDRFKGLQDRFKGLHAKLDAALKSMGWHGFGVPKGRVQSENKDKGTRDGQETDSSAAGINK